MSPDLDNTPTLPALISGAVANELAKVFTHEPGLVESYANGRATVKPLIPRRYVDEFGEFQFKSLPSIPNVPVIIPGSGGARITYPIQPGDTVLLLFCSNSIDQWLALDREVNPTSERHHRLSDAIAIAGLQATYVEHTVKIEFTGSEIHAGGSSALALKSDVEALKNAISGASSGDAVPAAAGAANITGTTVLKGS